MTNRLLKINFSLTAISHALVRLSPFKTRSLLLFSFLLSFCSCSILGSLLPSPEEFDYKVRAGDTLYQIAKNFEVSMLELQTLNRINNPRKIQIGQVIKIPSRGASSREAYGGPSVSAERAKRERARVVFPDVESLGIRMAMPVPDKKIGSPFGYRGTRFHEGIDITAEEGTPIYAAHDGFVIYSGERLSGYGKMIAVKNGQIMTVYAHNSENMVERGDVVRKGDKIAEVGATGRATGPHLHFETRVKASDGRYYAVDPFVFQKDASRRGN